MLTHDGNDTRRLKLFWIKPRVFYCFAENPRGVSAVKDGETGREPHFPMERFDNCERQPMECADKGFRFGYIVRRKRQITSEKLPYPLFHLARGFVGEGNGQNPLGRNARADQLRYPVHNDSRFPRAGSGKNQKRPFLMKDRFLLRIIQPVHFRTIPFMFPKKENNFGNTRVGQLCCGCNTLVSKKASALTLWTVLKLSKKLGLFQEKCFQRA